MYWFHSCSVLTKRSYTMWIERSEFTVLHAILLKQIQIYNTKVCHTTPYYNTFSVKGVLRSYGLFANQYWKFCLFIWHMNICLITSKKNNVMCQTWKLMFSGLLSHFDLIFTLLSCKDVNVNPCWSEMS